MSTLIGISPTLPVDTQNISALVLGQEANAKHELDRFGRQVAKLVAVRKALSRPGLQRVPTDLVADLLVQAADVSAFYKEVFSPEPNDWAVTLPLSMSAGRLHLAAARIERCVAVSQQKDAAQAALENFTTAWDTAMEIDGLANWPVLLKEIRFQRAAHAALRERLPAFDEATERVEAKLHSRIVDTLHGEMLAMAAYQPPEWREIAEEAINKDLRPAIQNIVDVYSGVELSYSSLNTADATLARVDLALWEAAIIEDDGRVWVAECEAATELLYDKNAPLTQRARLTEGAGIDARPVVAVVVPHADDESSKLGALIAELSVDNRVVLIKMADGSASSALVPDNDRPSVHRHLSTVRDDEMVRAAQAMGVSEVVMMQYGDSGMEADASAHRRRLADECPESVVQALVDAIGPYGPAAILTIQHVDDQKPYEHPDHQVTEECIRRAAEFLRGTPTNGVIPTYYVATLSEDLLANYHAALGLDELDIPLRLPTRTATTEVGLSSSSIANGRAALRVYGGTQVSDHPAALWQWMHPSGTQVRRVYPEPSEEQLKSLTATGPFESSLMIGEAVKLDPASWTPADDLTTKQAALDSDALTVGLSAPSLVG